MNAYNNPVFLAIDFIVPIIVVLAFVFGIKEKIKHKEEFDGAIWGLANGLAGPGILWVILGHSSINKEIAKVKSKKYKQYAQDQMGTFIKYYVIFLILRVFVTIFFFGSL